MSATASPSPALSTRALCARLVVRLDAAFEATLGGCCAVLAVRNPRQGVWRLPTHLSAAAVAVAALGLLAVAVLLWLLSGRSTYQLLAALCAANAATALAACGYAVAANAGSAVRLLLAGAALLLACLALTQASLVRRRPATH